MRRVFCIAAFVGAAVLPAAVAQPPAGWSTVKGQITFPAGAPIPERKALDVTQDKAHCLSKGPILDEMLVVNAKNRGVKNVVVWLRPDDDKNLKAKLSPDQIHPGDKDRKAATLDIDQPCCVFVNRITLARAGDTIRVKNSAPVAHNFFWTSGNNGDQNPTIPAGGETKVGPLNPETAPIMYKCSIHPWMAGVVRVYEHPYFALTDDDGKFTMPNAPQGKFRLMVWHEKAGFLGGKEGRFGTPIEIAGPVTELKAMDFPELAK